MKLSLIVFVSLVFLCSCEEKKPAESDKSKEAQAKVKIAIPEASKVYEVGCGLCVFDSEVPDTCESYVKIEGRVMPITGTVLDAHEVGLCEYKGTAYLDGEVIDGKFVSKFMKIKEFDKSKNYQE